jgi:LPXTG-motif cell wall-anchored protein
VSDSESCETDVVPPVTPPTVLSPEVEVLPRTFLPETGVNLPGLSAVGLAFLLLGFALVAASRRLAVSHVGMPTGLVIVRRLRGRAGYVLPGWFLLGFARIGHRKRRSSDRIQRIRRTGAGRT